MPISQYFIYKCPKCGYKLEKRVGDNLSGMEFFVLCPKCKTKMKVVDKYIPSSGGILSTLKNLFNI